jgi:adenosine deaminase
VELHCHVEGTLRPATVVELARKHDIAPPTEDVRHIYDYATIYEFLEIFRLVNSTVIDRDDFARVAYESLEDGVELGNLKYREMFFNPTLHTTRDVPMATIIDGLIDGAKAAEVDFGVQCRLIADVYRQDPVPMAMQMVEEVIANRRDELIGLGMDAAEAPDPPEQFAECFALAGDAGLRRTSHASEDAPPVNITTCLDVLGCERIDHGYHIIAADDVIARCRDEGIHFTCCPTSTAVVYGWPDLTAHPIKGMIAAGLLVHLNSDDPAMFHTDIGKEYVDFCGQNGYPPEVVKQLVRNGVDAAWLDDAEKAVLRAQFDAEIAELDATLDLATVPAPDATPGTTTRPAEESAAESAEESA